MSGGPFLCYRQLLPTNSVLFARFFRCDGVEHLITASVNSLNVYVVNRVADNNASKVSLVLLKYFQLFGRVNGLECFETSTLDARKKQCRILVCLDEGKLVVLEFISKFNELDIVHMFNAEEGGIGEGVDVHADSKGRRKAPGLYGGCPLCALDADSQLACSLLYGDQLFFVAMKGPVVSALGKKDVSTFLFDLANYFPFPQVRDMCFVSGFGGATLAVLLSSENVPVGHEKHRSALATVAFFAVDAASSALSLLWSQPGLPNDSHQLLPLRCSRLPGSLFVVGINSGILISRRGTCGWASNGLAAVSVSASIPLRPFNVPGCPHGLELVGSKWMQADENTLICSLSDGRLLSVSLARFREANALFPGNFEVKLLAMSVVCACLARTAAADAWFLGSANGDSILLSVTTSKDVRIADNGLFLSSTALHAIGTPSLKRRRVSRGGTPGTNLLPRLQISGALTSMMSVKDIADIIEAEETLLYGTTLKNIGLLDSMIAHSAFSLRVTDVVAGLGPVLDGLCGSYDDSSLSVPQLQRTAEKSNKLDSVNKLNSAAAYIAERELRDGLQVSNGTGGNGGVCRLYSGYRVSKVATREFGDCVSVQSLTVDSAYFALFLLDSGGVSDKSMRHGHYMCTLFFLTMNSGTTKLLLSTGSAAHGDTAKKSTKGRHAHALHSSTSAIFTESNADAIGFVGEHPTLRVGTLGGGAFAVQIMSIGIRVTQFSAADLPAPLQDMLVEEDVDIGGLGGLKGELIVQADISEGGGSADSFVAILSSLGNIYVLKFDFEDRALVIVYSSSRCNDGKGSPLFFPPGTYSCVSLFGGVLPELVFASHSPVDTAPLSPLITAEEAFLYGAGLGDNDAMKESVTSVFPTAPEDCYLILCDKGSRLHCIRLSDMRYVFCTDSVGAGKRCVEIFEKTQEDSGSNDRTNAVIDICLSYIGRGSPGETGHVDRLTIVACLDSADVVIYSANSHIGPLATFVKVPNSTVSRLSKRRMKLRRTYGSFASKSDTPMDEPSAYNLRRFLDLDGRRGILCSGLRPLIVVNDSGLPTLLPISLPELPFSSIGYYSVAPVCYAGGAFRGICCLWVEIKSHVDDASAPPPPTRPPGSLSFQPPLPLQPRPPNFSIASVLGLYREMLGLTVLSNSCLTYTRSLVGHTVHRIQEVLPKTDDKVQLSLLKHKTFILSTSIETESDFKEDVLTEEEVAEDKAHYDRYFPSLKSFGQNNNELGPPPSEKRDQHSILLIQNNSVVDEYQLPAFETVLGIETLYFEVAISKPGDPPTAPVQEKKVVFVAACTSIDDKHGDDSQSEGRILFFAVDYALYEGNGAVEVEHKQADVADSTQMKVDSAIEIVTADSSYNAGVPHSAIAQSTVQANFLGSISPKLKLLWTGPGPSTVIKQLGKRYVIATLGSVLYIYNYNPQTAELDQLSFYFAPVG